MPRRTTPRLGLPNLGLGVGLRHKHFPHIMRECCAVDWFEIISENFIDNYGYARHVLEHVATRCPVVMHGVSLSIGSADPINFAYLDQLKALARDIRPTWISDHLCWTGVAGRNVHDLLPMPYTEEALRHTAARVREVSEVLERPLVLENPSSYVEFADSRMTEWEFLSRLAAEADCGLLLDVNNVYVSSFNHGFDPRRYIDAIPPDRVVQYHLAGHTHKGTHIVDTHSDHAIEEVWDLYARSCRRTGNVATLYEWDEDIPSFEVVHAEALKARAFREQALLAAAR